MNRTLALAASALLFAGCSHDANNTPPDLPAGCTLPDPQVSGLSVEQVIELNVHQVGERLNFTVPPNTGSISIVEQASGDVPLLVVFGQGDAGQVFDNSAVPRFVYFPDGGVAYDDFKTPPVGADKTTDPSTAYIEYSVDTPVASSFTFPNTSNSLASGVAPGTWSFVVGDFAYECANGAGCIDGGTNLDRYDVKVLLRPLAGGTTLDVNFYIVGAATNQGGIQLTAANAAADARVKRMIATFTSFYAAAGIVIGQVNFFDVTAEQRASFAHLTVSDDGGGQGPCDSLAQMFRISAAHPGLGMNLFLVNDITDTSATGGNQVVGIDGTIPGPSSITGTVNSGAAVALSDLFAGVCTATAPSLGCGADRVAYIAAHETGHFLGLFHTTESGGDLVDPLNDTGKCVCTACASATDKPNCGRNDSSAPQLSANRCNGAASTNCSGADNLMFWLFDQSVSQGHLTDEQGRVMRLNPLVQ